MLIVPLIDTFFALFYFCRKSFISECFRHDLFRKKMKILLKNITDIFVWAESIWNIPGTIYSISFMFLQPLDFKVTWHLLPKAFLLCGCWACRDVWFWAVNWYCHYCQQAFGASLSRETEVFQAGWPCQNFGRQDIQLCTCLSRAVPAQVFFFSPTLLFSNSSCDASDVRKPNNNNQKEKKNPTPNPSLLRGWCGIFWWHVGGGTIDRLVSVLGSSDIVLLCYWSILALGDK